MMLKLNENEKIYSWDVIVETTDGRLLTCDGDLGLELPYTAANLIDQTLEEFYPCSWRNSISPCESCRKCGEITCGNDTKNYQCFESR